MSPESPFPTMISRLFLILLLLAPVCLRAATDPEARFASANAAYASGDFQVAADTYRALISEGTRDPDVFFNLGNAEFRLDHRGLAALAYERALLLDPTHAESRQNLRFLTRKTGRLVEEPTAFVRFGQRFAENTVVVALSVCAWLFILALAARMFLQPRPGGTRACLYSLAVIGFLGSSVAGTILAAQILHAPPKDRVIVTAEDAKAYTTPALSAKEVISLPPGSVLRVLSSRESWSYVALPGDLRGWVESDAIESLGALDAMKSKNPTNLVGNPPE